MVDVTSWRWLFLINLPAGLWIYLGAHHLKRTELHSGRSPDLVGATVFALAVASLALIITQGEDWVWDSARMLGGPAATVLFGAIAIRRSATHPTPALEIVPWRSRVYATANGISSLFGAALYIVLIAGVVFLVDVWGYSPPEAGLAVTPGALTSAAVGIHIGRLARRPASATLVAAGTAGRRCRGRARPHPRLRPEALGAVGADRARARCRYRRPERRRDDGRCSVRPAAEVRKPRPASTSQRVRWAARSASRRSPRSSRPQPGEEPINGYRAAYRVIALASFAILPLTPLLRPRLAQAAATPPVNTTQGAAE